MTQMTHASWGVRHLRHADGAAIGEHSAKPDGDPESRRLCLPMASNREAMCGSDYFVAAPDESLETFRARLKKIARERGGVVALGHEDNSPPPRKSAFALDGSRLSEDGGADKTPEGEPSDETGWVGLG